MKIERYLFAVLSALSVGMASLAQTDSGLSPKIVMWMLLAVSVINGFLRVAPLADPAPAMPKGS